VLASDRSTCVVDEYLSDPGSVWCLWSWQGFRLLAQNLNSYTQFMWAEKLKMFKNSGSGRIFCQGSQMLKHGTAGIT
jgi:hypothetical protein